MSAPYYTLPDNFFRTLANKIIKCYEYDLFNDPRLTEAY